MEGIAATVSCELEDEGASVVVSLDVALPYDEPQMMTLGITTAQLTEIGQGELWFPWAPISESFASQLFEEGERITFAIALGGHTLDAPEWDHISWIWQQTYQASMGAEGPELVAVT